MKSLHILYTILIFNLVANAQSNFNNGFKEGFKKGYCYSSSNNATSYCTPPYPPYPPYPQYNESSSSYNDGYNRGFLYGQEKRSQDDDNSNNNAQSYNYPQFSKYVSQTPVDLMVMQGINLQRKFDSRATWLQNRIDELGGLYERFFINQNFQKTNIENVKMYVKSEHVEFINSLRGADLGNDYIFNNIVNELNSIIENTYKNYNICVEAENKRR
ncbi:hypothetical protein [Flavobacterium sp.]|jgi:hypothetical protein|uniref:hypothetical protein n=1 Tax=Flavobacterium sp. TaxID=239 RepID=UPI0037C03FF0